MKSLYFILCLVAIVSCYRQEQIISAEEVRRDSINKILHSVEIGHYGVLVKTNLGNTYLIHNMPNTGVVVTQAPMSNKWIVLKNISINGHKTIGSAMEYASGFTDVAVINYLTNGTCIGTKNKINGYLKN